MARLIFIGAFLGWAVLVATSDIRFRRVRNSLVVVGSVSALVATAISQNPFGVSLTQALVGVAVGLVCFFPLFALRVMGAADVKVFAILGAWCGAPALLWLWIAASLAAAVHALWVMLLSRTSVIALYRRATPSTTLGGRRATPYAAFLVTPAAIWLLHLVYVRGM